MIKKTLTAIAALAMAATTASAQQVTQKVEQMLVHLFDGNTVYYNVSDVDYVDYQDEVKVNVCPDGNHPHAIDLGLPSGTKWACCNVGATSPEQSGGYYAWAVTETQDDYSRTKYKYYKAGQLMYDIKDENISGTSKDAAYVNMGSSWKMALKEQWCELFDNSNITKSWATVEANGKTVEGILFTSTNGSTLFMPATGYRGTNGEDDFKITNPGSVCFRMADDPVYYMGGIHGLNLDKSKYNTTYPINVYHYCNIGVPVRAVVNE